MVTLLLVLLVLVVASAVVPVERLWRRRAERARRAEAFRRAQLAEVLPAHPLGWRVQLLGGVITATHPVTGERATYSPARYGWVKA